MSFSENVVSVVAAWRDPKKTRLQKLQWECRQSTRLFSYSVVQGIVFERAVDHVRRHYPEIGR